MNRAHACLPLCGLMVVSLLIASCSGGGNEDAGNEYSVDSGNNNPGSNNQNNVPNIEIDLSNFQPDPAQLTGDLPRVEPPLDSAGFDYYTTHPGSSVLNGPVVGPGLASDAAQVRNLSYQIGYQQPGLELEHVYAFRNQPSGLAARTGLVLTVKNSSSELLCFVKATEAVLFDLDDRPVGDDQFNTLFSAGRSFVARGTGEADFYSHSCVPDGERAYLFASFDIVLDKVKGASIESIQGRSANDYTPVNAPVVAIQYETRFENELLRVIVQNQSDKMIRVVGGDHILLDAVGVPLFHRFSTFQLGVGGRPDETFAPGEERVEDVVIGGFLGQASTIRSMFSVEFID